jgi:L-threonylcarbamoyladenylate synthase
MITTNIAQAKEALMQNDVVAIPTETVYELAGNAFSVTAVKKIFALKKRPFYNPLIVHIGSAEQLQEIALDIPPMAMQLAKAFWPCPLTLLLKKQSSIPDLVTAGSTMVAVRMRNLPLTLQLLQALPFPWVAPSANPFTSISPTNALHVYQYFKEEVPVILDGGACSKGVESTIVGFDEKGPVLYRLGALALEDIEAVTHMPLRIMNNAHHNRPDAPGMLGRHYAPRTVTYLTDNVEELLQQIQGKKIGLLLWKAKINPNNHYSIYYLSANQNMEEATSNLYALLHDLDKQELDVIIAERLPNEGLGRTINDRLQRATRQAE